MQQKQRLSPDSQLSGLPAGSGKDLTALVTSCACTRCSFFRETLLFSGHVRALCLTSGPDGGSARLSEEVPLFRSLSLLCTCSNSSSKQIAKEDKKNMKGARDRREPQLVWSPVFEDNRAMKRTATSALPPKTFKLPFQALLPVPRLHSPEPTAAREN